MIGKLKGIIDSCLEDSVILDVGGVGYHVFLSASNLHNLILGDELTLLIISHVREDHIHLYGFKTLEEKLMFTLLQSVSGIGPRMALSILSMLSPEQIQIAVNTRDKDIFKNVSGVGAKIAERIIIELKSKVSSIISHQGGNKISNTSANSIAQDAISALVNLGIKGHEAQKTVENILFQNPDSNLNELITLALKPRAQNV